MVNQDIGIWNLQYHGSGMDQVGPSIRDVLPSRLIPSLKQSIPLIINQSRHPFLPDPPIDCSDNDVQLQVIQHHYLKEFETDDEDMKNDPVDSQQNHIREVIKDYAPNSVIHKVLDDVPTTYRGRRGVEEMCREIYGQLKSIELEHVAVDHNHARVIWKGETKGPSHTTIFGRDFFTFDNQNHIVSQTIVALTQQDQTSK